MIFFLILEIMWICISFWKWDILLNLSPFYFEYMGFSKFGSGRYEYFLLKKKRTKNKHLFFAIILYYIVIFIWGIGKRKHSGEKKKKIHYPPNKIRYKLFFFNIQEKHQIHLKTLS